MIDFLIDFCTDFFKRRKRYRQLKKLRQWRDAALKVCNLQQQIEAIEKCKYVKELTHGKLQFGSNVMVFAELFDGTLVSAFSLFYSEAFHEATLKVYKTVAQKISEK